MFGRDAGRFNLAHFIDLAWVGMYSRQEVPVGLAAHESACPAARALAPTETAPA